MTSPPKSATIFKRFKEQDLARARVSLWVFKKKISAKKVLSFQAAWVDISKPLANELRKIAISAQELFTEEAAYGLLVQPNDEQLLVLSQKGTAFTALEAAVDGREEANQAKDLTALQNAAGYLVKLDVGGSTLFCIRKTSNDWKVRQSKTVLNLLFAEKQLDLAEDPVFRIARAFDFFAFDKHLMIADKRAFESLMGFKSTYERSFAELREEPEFQNMFTTLVPLEGYVSTNAMQLRRMAVVRDRAYYKDAKYIARLQSVNEERKWGIMFDANGLITPTDATARVIVQVLLNHRLFSELSLETYDVPSTVPV